MTTPRVTVPVEDLAGKLKAIRDKFLMPTPDKDFTDYAVMTRCIDALSAAPVREEGGAAGVASAAGMHFATVDRQLIGEGHETYAAALAEARSSLAAREEAPAEAVEDDDDASIYRPSVAGLSDYLWNQALAAESVESRCILEMWREAVDSNAQTGESAKTLDRLCRVEDWAQAPSALRAQPPAREDAQPVAWRWRTRVDGVWNYQEARQVIPGSESQPLYTHPAPDALRDAERYRYLRSRDPGPDGALPPAGLFIGRVPDNVILTEGDADAAIDQALAALQAEQKGGAS